MYFLVAENLYLGHSCTSLFSATQNKLHQERSSLHTKVMVPTVIVQTHGHIVLVCIS